MRSSLDNVLPDVAFRRLSVASAFIFDVDRTLADPHERMEEGILSELARLRVPAGVATARTLSELEESLPSGTDLFDHLRGDLLLEDGGVIVRGGQPKGSSVEIQSLVSRSELAAIGELREVLRREFVSLSRDDGFGMFKDLPAPLVKFPPVNDFLTSITLWEKGPVGDPTFALAYHFVATRMREHNLDQVLTLTEVGDGTLRVTAPATNKGSGLERLSRMGRIDLSRIAYFGDGANDIPAAVTVKAHGGVVISVGSSTPALVSLADYVTTGDGPRSVAAVLRRLNRVNR